MSLEIDSQAMSLAAIVNRVEELGRAVNALTEQLDDKATRQDVDDAVLRMRDEIAEATRTPFDQE
jgi:hypothetical protein